MSRMLLVGDCRETLLTLPDEAVQCCVTSPPYWQLRDYGHPNQLGLEETIDDYVAAMVGVFRQVRRVLREDGTLWLNLGDAYFTNSHCARGEGLHADYLNEHHTRVVRKGPSKSLCGAPWRVALALQSEGWILRSDIIWAKRNAMPESVRDRPSRSHEYVFLFAKSGSYYYDSAALREKALTPGRQKTLSSGRVMTTQETVNGRTVWDISTSHIADGHYAPMPEQLVQRCILAGSPIGSTVLDPFLGSGTTARVAESLGRRWIGCELSDEYQEIIAKRTVQCGLPFAQPEVLP